MYIVICLADPSGEAPGVYVAAKATLFALADDAARYAATVAASREPRIVSPSEYLQQVRGWGIVEPAAPAAPVEIDILQLELDGNLPHWLSKEGRK